MGVVGEFDGRQNFGYLFGLCGKLLFLAHLTSLV